jgi:hypothetical protein
MFSAAGNSAIWTGDSPCGTPAAIPNKRPSGRKAARAYFITLDTLKEKQAKPFEGGVPTARVIRLRGAHYIFLSNEPDVLREMRAFLAGLK